MKVCQILAGDEEGGLEKHFEELCNKMAQTHEVHVIAHEKYRERFAENIVFHALDLSKGRRNLLVLYRLKRTIDAIGPDIVHAHANKAADMTARIRKFLKPSVRTVATLHSKKRRLKAFEMFDHVIGVSHEVLRTLKNPRKSVVYNGIGIGKEEWEPQVLSEFGIKDAFVVCAIGRLEAVKNFSLLIRSVRNLDVTLLIIGEGSEEKKLRTLVKELCLEERVIFTGFRKDAKRLLANSDLCAISSDREGFSYVMAEALLLRVPVVSTDVGDMRRILPAGYVVGVKDEEALAEKIARAKTHYDDLMKAYGPSFRFAEEHFTLDAMVSGTMEVYDEVIREKRV